MWFTIVTAFVCIWFGSFFLLSYLHAQEELKRLAGQLDLTRLQLKRLVEHVVKVEVEGLVGNENDPASKLSKVVNLLALAELHDISLTAEELIHLMALVEEFDKLHGAGETVDEV
ncbi:MAG: hypothetical protein AUJ19_02670 [Parcubacteria group bacterium CG1_02_58_44]|nr:MAG: hypothetical protein AUJ19_02670 [Parcubacteria group bacterium CG1_02_58_44]